MTFVNGPARLSQGGWRLAINALLYVKLLVWPAVILAVVGMFHDPISRFIDRAGEITFSRNGFRISAAAVKVTENLIAATAQRSTAETNLPVRPTVALGPTIASAITQATINPKRVRALWVDDRPDGNQNERNALRAIGFEFVTELSTDAALSRLREAKYDLIISDFGRKDDSQGGYTLLEQVKKLPSAPPFIIYTVRADASFEKGAKEIGAFGVTNDPNRLFELAVEATREN